MEFENWDKKKIDEFNRVKKFIDSFPFEKVDTTSTRQLNQIKENVSLYNTFNEQYRKLVGREITIVDFAVLADSYYNKKDCLTELLFCSYCGNPTHAPFRNKGFTKYCCHECAWTSKEPIKIARQRYKDRTGYDHQMHNPDVVQQMLDTRRINNPKPPVLSLEEKVELARKNGDNWYNYIEYTPTEIDNTYYETYNLKTIQELGIIQYLLSHFKFEKYDLNGKAYCNQNNRLLYEDFRSSFIDMLGRDISPTEFKVYAKNYNDPDFPKTIFCKYCGNPTHVKNTTNGFHKYCSRNCVSKSDETKTLREETTYLIYGVKNSSQCTEIKQKTAATNEKRYQNKCSLLNPIVAEKARLTRRERYGFDHHFSSPEIQAKIRETMNLLYGCDSPLQNSEIKAKYIRTMNERYGCDWPFQNPEIFAKARQTCLEKFGKEWYVQSEQFVIDNMGRYHEPYYACTREFQERQRETKMRNNSYAGSKPEKFFVEESKKYFPKVIPQYRSELYPYNCDLYIDINGYLIECNFMWTHGEEPFDENNPKHLEILAKWKEKAKTSDFYKSAIYVWTELDVRKRRVAQENGLRYLTFYTLEESLAWLYSLHNKHYYRDLQFNDTKMQSIWDNTKNRKIIISWCLEWLNAGLGEINKHDITTAMLHLWNV